MATIGRLLRFVGRWWLIAVVAAWIVFGTDPRWTAGTLLAGLVYRNWRCRRLQEQLRRFGVGFLVAAAALAVALVVPRPAPALAAEVRPGAVSLGSSAGLGAGLGADGLPGPYGWLLNQGLHLAGQAFRGEIAGSMLAAQATFQTPPVDHSARIVQLWQVLAVVADSLLLLLVVVGGAMIVAGDWSYLAAKELAPRLVVAAITLNLSLIITGEAISLANAVVTAILADGKALLGSSDLVGNGVGGAPLLLALLFVLVVALLVIDAVRLVLVVALAVGAPILHAFGVLPATDGIARGWWRALAAVLVTPVVQAFLLVVGAWIATSPASPLMVLCANQPWKPFIDASMVIAVVALMAISPVWMLKHALGGQGQHLRAAFRSGRRMVTGGLS